MRASTTPATWVAVAAAAGAVVAAVACARDEPDRQAFRWELPPGVPAPFVPEDNPMSYEKVELGRHLFYDTRLSGNGEQSCASCHRQELAFADGEVLPVGSTGETVPRNAPALMNVAYYGTLSWQNPDLETIEQQMITPLFGDDPIEMGVSGHEEVVLERLRGSPLYQDLFARAFPDDPVPIGFRNAVRAIASFLRTMSSFDSPYDRYTLFGDENALSPAARRGLDLFLGARLDCHQCHRGLQLTRNVRHEETVTVDPGFANNGLYNLDELGSYPPPNDGLYRYSGHDADRGKFRTPSLRNIALTAPYMHDGSVETLEEVVRIYSEGGRNVTSGPHAGDGRDNPNKSEHVHGFDLTDDELADLLALFDAFTDPTFVTAPAFSDPFE